LKWQGTMREWCGHHDRGVTQPFRESSRLPLNREAQNNPFLKNRTFVSFEMLSGVSPQTLGAYKNQEIKRHNQASTLAFNIDFESLLLSKS